MKYFTRLSSLLIILLISGQVALAQKATEPKAPVQFGEVTNADFLPSRDSAAAAEILCDYGQSGIVGAHEKFQVTFERVTRIHILRKSGYDWATVQVPLYVKDENKEKLSNLKGFTYNLVDGKVEKTKLRREHRRLQREGRQEPRALLLYHAQRARGRHCRVQLPY